MASSCALSILIAAAVCSHAHGWGHWSPRIPRTRTTHTRTTMTRTTTTKSTTSFTGTTTTKSTTSFTRTGTSHTSSTRTTTTRTSTTATTTLPVYKPKDQSLLNASTAPVFTFFVYRVAGNRDYDLDNVNAANLAGIMWYLHNEVVSHTPRKFGATRILRYKVTTKATTPLLQNGMHFGIRYAFDYGRCAGPYDCQEQFDKFGYFVGCNYVNQYPTSQWRKLNHYPGAIWYSFPGPCTSKLLNEKSDPCRLLEPGGRCTSPTGQGNCTYSVAPAGFIYINELVGIGNYYEFLKRGGIEYDPLTDIGTLTTFWNNKTDPAACWGRMQAAQRHFAWRYGWHYLHEPRCDFNLWKFFPGGKMPASKAPKSPPVWYA